MNSKETTNLILFIIKSREETRSNDDDNVEQVCLRNAILRRLRLISYLPLFLSKYLREFVYGRMFVFYGCLEFIARVFKLIWTSFLRVGHMWPSDRYCGAVVRVLQCLRAFFSRIWYGRCGGGKWAPQRLLLGSTAP